MKASAKGVAVALGGLLAFALPAGVWLERALAPEPVPANVTALEDAMALPGVVAIAQLDVAHGLAIARRFGQAPDPATLAAAFGPDSLAAALLDAGIDPAAALDHFVATLAPREGDARWLYAVTGRLPVGRIREVLSTHGRLTLDGSLWILDRDDPESCEAQPPLALSIDAERAIIGAPDLVRAVQQRLSAGSAPGADLTQWRRFREGRTGSVGLLAPGVAHEGFAESWTRRAASVSGSSFAAVETLQLGVAFGAWPPGARVSGAVVATPAWSAAQASRLESWRDELLAGSSDSIPTLERLIERIDVEVEVDTLRVRARLDRDLPAQLSSLVGEASRVAFAAGGLEPRAADAPVAERTIDPDSLPLLESGVSLASLPDAASDATLSALRGQIAGPFSLRLRAQRVLPERDDRYELEIAAESVPIPNLATQLPQADGAARLLLEVTSVRSRDGEEWLARERCGRERNHEGAAFRPGIDSEWRGRSFVKVAPRYSANKAVRLAPEARLEAVARVEGVVTLRLPTELETIVLAAPLAGQRIERDGLRIVFRDAGRDALAYEISGHGERLLAVRARNPDGDLLSPAGSSASSVGWRPGTRVEHRYHGRPARFEVILAASEAVARYPFALEDLAPRYAGFAAGPIATPAVEDRASFERAAARAPLSGGCGDSATSEARLGPFALCLFSSRAAWGRLSTELSVLAPGVPSLSTALPTLELRVDGVELARPDGGSVLVSAPLRHFVSPRRRLDAAHLEERVWLHAPLAGEAQGVGAVGEGEVRSIRGRLLHRVPLQVHPLALELDQLGNAIEYSNGFGMQWVERAEGRLAIDLHGERARIVGVRARDAAGAEIALRNPRFDALPEDARGRPHWRLEFEVASAPRRLEIEYALAMDEIEVPFILASSKAADASLAVSRGR